MLLMMAEFVVRLTVALLAIKNVRFWVDKWAYIGSLSRGYPCAFNRYFLTLISGYLDQLNAVCV